MRMAKLYLGVLGLAASAILLNCCIPTREASCGDGKQCTPAGQDDGPPQPEPPMPECTSQNDCLDAKACVNQKCVVCSNHDDCTSRLCEPQDDPTKPNRCLDPSQVYVVDATADPGRCGTPDGGGPDGSVANPFCRLQDALRAMPYRYAIRLVGSKTFDVEYTGPFDLGSTPNRSFRIFGSGPANPDQGRPVLTAAAMDTIITLAPSSGQTKVVLDGVSIFNANGGVDCKPLGVASQPLLEIHRSTFSGSAFFGLQTSQCDVTVTRSMFRALPNIAFYIDEGKYTLTDNFFTRNGGDGKANESPLTFHYTRGVFANNTVVANIGTPIVLGGKKSVNCNNLSTPLQDSIILSDPNAYESQFTGNCQLTNVVVHPSETYASLGKIPAMPSFTQTGPTYYSLLDDKTNEQCCINKVDSPLSSTDYFGNPRPLGLKADIGAHEVK